MKKQIIDQSLHTAIGFAVTFWLTHIFNPALAPMIMIFGAYARELHQHDYDQLGKGSHLDLCFWWLGGMIAIITTEYLL